MATNSTSLISLLAGLLFAGPMSGAPLSCPTHRHGYRLTQFGIFDGSPAKGYEHAPDDEGQSNSTWAVKRFPGGEPDGFHLLCTYNHGGTVDLLIPATATVCKMTGSALIPNAICQ